MQRNAYISTAAAVVLMVGGPAAAVAASPSDAARTGSAAAARVDVDAAGAAAAAVKHYPGTVESLDKDGPVWHVDVIGKNGTHAELTVDTRSGKVFTENADDDGDDDSGEQKQLLAAKVTAQQAIKAAVKAHPGQVQSVDWDDDGNGGSDYWNVEIKSANGDTKNVHVDPTTGKATVSSSDSDNDENDDDENDN
ncbi:PepSY domain-containing protein [Streptomyces sp. NBC_01551]|uniref:PepSY domain-containing protein n=1 Tax=Streptomyces sp. NBC_01551 TaxID=2975876 RepID=UPI00225949BC|nr:PepSY domain-containing protein [Streptomyces sp. NBC_01551]MCX4528160.1 PepSY domain-containing protein [Streptomyces sp. NBC_01551]